MEWQDQLLSTNCYRSFLRYLLDEKVIVGGQKKLADILQCQPAYLSRVFKEESNLSPEQALNLCAHLECPPHLIDYYIGLLSMERAGTEKLKNYWQEKLQILRFRYGHEGGVAPEVFGGYTRAQKSHWIGTFRCARPLFSDERRFELYTIKVDWSDSESCLVFREKRVGLDHSGRIYFPDNMYFLYFLTIEKGAARLMTLVDIESDSGSGKLSGLVMTIANPESGSYYPSSYKVAVERGYNGEEFASYVDWEDRQMEAFRSDFESQVR